jgi:integrase
MITRAVVDYIALRRASGYKFHTEASILLSFAAFADERRETYVRAGTAVEWAARARGVASRVRRLDTVIRFARHAKVADKRHEIPPPAVFGRGPRRASPHLLSPEQIRDVIGAAAAMGPRGSLRPKTFGTLFGLLASSGLRAKEALALEIDDVTPDGLVIRRTKFRKSRLVPLHPTTAAALGAYLRERGRVATVERHVFITMRGKTPLSYMSAATTFLRIVRALGIHGGTGTRRPGLHDLRHTFAVRSLEACAMRSEDVSRHMLALSTYLGHANPSDTYWYLQATPALLTKIAAAAEAKHEEVVR